MWGPYVYGDEIASILESCENGERLMPLAPTEPVRAGGLKRLRKLSSRDLFGEKTVVADEFADCVRSGLFLYFSALDESHTISQSIPTATGSYLHGMMHRQEPDFSNAKYWFRRVSEHEVFIPLRENVLQSVLGADENSAAAQRLRAHIESLAMWDPFWFIDQCAEAVGGGDADQERLACEVQRVEWQLLFDYCYRKAVGEDAESGPAAV